MNNSELKEQQNVSKCDEKKEYEEKVDRLLKRWKNEKVQTTSSRKDTNRLQGKFENQRNCVCEGQWVEERRKTPIFAHCDILVVGGGPAGLSAAIAASRAGASVTIIQKFGCFGGVITTVGMQTLGWYRYQGTSDTEGIGRQLQRLAKSMGASSKWAFNDSDCLDTEQFKIIADSLIEKHNIRPLLHTYVVDTLVKDNKVIGVIIESKSGREAIYAKRVVDCSGDADVAYYAGCKFTSIPVDKALGVTTVFNVAGVDSQKFLKYIEKAPQTYDDWNTGTWHQDTTGKQDSLKSPYFGRQFKEADKKGLLSDNDSKLCLTGSWSALSEAGEATNLNLVHMKGFNTTDKEDLTKAQMLGRKGTVKALNVLKQIVPGFEKAKLRNLARTLGIRDSRKIVGRYNLTGEDVCKQARFQDTVGVFPEFVDGYSILILPSTGRYFQVPYGCLIPDVDNLLVGGRCVSGDLVSHAATRNMMCCTVTGQAAGIAAAVSLANNCTTMQIPIQKIQQQLRRQGARID